MTHKPIRRKSFYHHGVEHTITATWLEGPPPTCHFEVCTVDRQKGAPTVVYEDTREYPNLGPALSDDGAARVVESEMERVERTVTAEEDLNVHRP